MKHIEHGSTRVAPTACVTAKFHNSAGPGQLVQLRGQPVSPHQDLRTTGPAAGRMLAAYQPDWRIDGAAPDSVVIRRSGAGPMTLDEVELCGRVAATVHSTDRIIVIHPRDGSLLHAGEERASKPDEALLVAPGLSSQVQLHDVSFAVVGLDPSLLRAVAFDLPNPLPAEIRFLDRRPLSAAASETWQRAMDYATSTLAAAEIARQPLVFAATARMVAATLLECFTSNIERRPAPLTASSVPDPLNRAVAFIHHRVRDNIGINEIAESVHLTPRAVQYLFRRGLDTTPTEYLRQVRLQRAHQDLIAGDRAATTVGAIATKWGFSHTGRFAVLYRQTYGQSPHATLRG